MNPMEFVTKLRDMKKKPGGSLRFFGEWFGRPYDNYHAVIDSHYEHDVLEIKCSSGEVIKVSAAIDISVTNNGLTIMKAERVEFHRYYYEGLPINENTIVDIYSHEKKSPRSNGKLFYKKMNENYPAVEIL